MHNARSGASVHHTEEAGEVLSPAEVESRTRGAELKRVIRAAAALHGLYDDSAIGERVHRSRATVAGWWKGAQPSPDTLAEIAAATGLSVDELTRFVYFDGPAPRLVAPGSPVDSAVQEGIRRDRERPQPEGPQGSSPSPERRTRGT